MKNLKTKFLQTLCHCIFLRKENAGNSRWHKVIRTRGSVLTLAVLIFATASTILGLGISLSTVKNIQNTRGGSYSKQALYTAESLQEDVLYRLKRNILLSPTEILSLANATATATITDIPYGKKVAITSNSSDYIRKIQSTVSQGAGSSFAYAIQAGAGGFSMKKSTIEGNIYSNGPIVSDTVSIITGGAISASDSPENSLISGVSVGVDAWAHNVSSSTIGANNFCQVGSLNNKPCNTTRPDPVVREYPISDATIDMWKAEALAGGTTSAVKISTDDVHLGPIKIVGDMVVDPTTTFYLDGILWVTGNLLLGNKSNLILAPDYIGNGMIIVDGKIIVDQNASFAGGSKPGSYVMLLTTSDCDGVRCGGGHAIDINNNASGVILNAQKGSVHFGNNSTAKAVTAFKIDLANNANIIYDVGLIETFFSTGPMGSWAIDSWQETVR